MGWLFMDDDMDARRSNGGTVEVEGPMDLGPGRKIGVDAGAAHEVEGQNGLGQKAAPEMEGEALVCGAEAGNEVVLESTDCPFGRIAAMDAGGGELEINVGFMEETFEGGGGFVVHALEARSEAMGGEYGVSGFVGGEDGCCRLGLHGLGVDEVGVVAVDDEELGVALAGRENETTRLVSEHLAS